MSSTYVSNYYSAALRGTSGYAYVMFYETCESNVCPRTPRWRAQYFGPLPQVLSEVVEYVDCCDGGMTKGAGGRAIRAETFLRRTEGALLAADLVTDRITLEFGEHLRAIPIADLAAFDEAAQGAGITIHFTRDGEACGAKFASRTIDLGDPATVDMLLAFRREANVAVWQIFNMRDMARLPVPVAGAWTPASCTTKEYVQATAQAMEHLARHRLIKMRCPWPGSDYVREEFLVLDEQQRALTSSPLRWFCQGFLGEGRCTKLGESSAALKAFRGWMTAATISLDAPSCEVEATPRGGDAEASASIAAKLTNGRSTSLPARGPASAVFDELRYCDAARFSVVGPQLRTVSNLSLL